MREIKFRAYDLKKKIIFPVHKIDFNKINQSIEFIQGYDDWDKDGYIVYGGGIMKYANKDRYILMQYTGLHDKNGKEIYEGDIILTQPLRDKPFSQKAKSKRLKAIVQYNVKCGKNFVREPDKIKYWGAEWDIEIIDKKAYEKYHNFGWGVFFECEVIGNIYDNPELLKEE